MMSSDESSLLTRLSVMFRKADHCIEEWVLHFVDQIEEENCSSTIQINKNKNSS